MQSLFYSVHIIPDAYILTNCSFFLYKHPCDKKFHITYVTFVSVTGEVTGPRTGDPNCCSGKVSCQYFTCFVRNPKDYINQVSLGQGVSGCLRYLYDIGHWLSSIRMLNFSLLQLPTNIISNFLLDVRKCVRPVWILHVHNLRYSIPEFQMSRDVTTANSASWKIVILVIWICWLTAQSELQLTCNAIHLTSLASITAPNRHFSFPFRPFGGRFQPTHTHTHTHTHTPFNLNVYSAITWTRLTVPNLHTIKLYKFGNIH
jgi:hypothetical protein